SAVSDLVVSPDGRFVYAAQGELERIAVIDTDTGEITYLEADGNPYKIAVSPDGGLIVTNDVPDQSIRIDDPGGVTPTTTVDVGARPSGIAVTDRYVVTASSAAGTVSVVDLQTRTLVETIDVDDIPDGVVVSPDGRYAYVTSKSENTLSVIDLE